MSTEYWYYYECYECTDRNPTGCVVDVRLNVELSGTAESFIQCPFCKKPMAFKGRERATDTGHQPKRVGNNYTKQGLLRNKYTVTCNDDRSEDADAKFFVLRYDKSDEWGEACRAALAFFAERIQNDYPQLAADLKSELAGKEERE